MNYDINFMIPCNFNYEMAIKKGLYQKKSLTENYQTIVKNYRVILEYILNESLNLKWYDQQIKECNLYMTPVDKNKQDMYQRNSTLGCDFIYLRNNFYIERLEEEDLKLFSIFPTTKEEIDKRVERVLFTFPMIIKENNNMMEMESYGPDNPYFCTFPNSLVIAVRRKKFNLEGIPEEKKGNIYLEQESYFRKLVVQMNENFLGKYDIPISVFQYGDWDVYLEDDILEDETLEDEVSKLSL